MCRGSNVFSNCSVITYLQVRSSSIIIYYVPIPTPTKGMGDILFLVQIMTALALALA